MSGNSGKSRGGAKKKTGNARVNGAAGNTGATGNASGNATDITGAAGNILSAAYAADGKTKLKKPRKRKNVDDIDGRPLVVVNSPPLHPPPPPPLDPSVALKGKRKKKTTEFPNPLFLRWLEEWKAEARTKDNKNLTFVYSKVID